MKLRAKKDGRLCASNSFDRAGTGQIKVYFPERAKGPYDLISDVSSNYEVWLVQLEEWKCLARAFDDRDVIPNSLISQFGEPSTAEERERGFSEMTTTPTPARQHLPLERQSITHKFRVEGHKGYLTVGLFENGQPGELFVRMSKQGSTMSGMCDSFATMTSIALQYGVPIKQLCSKFVGVRYEPQGRTSNANIPNVLSITDYIFKWLAFKFLSEEERAEVGIRKVTS